MVSNGRHWRGEYRRQDEPVTDVADIVTKVGPLIYEIDVRTVDPVGRNVMSATPSSDVRCSGEVEKSQQADTLW